jgi:hypothetical protein
MERKKGRKMKDKRKFGVYLSAGARPMSEEDPRPEFVAKADLFKDERVRAAKKLGINPGLQLVGFDKFPADFDPWELGCRYAIHAPNEILTQLYQAHLQQQQSDYDRLWAHIVKMGKLDPAPNHVTFHLGGTQIVPNELDAKRFNVIADPEAVWQHLCWLRDIFRKIIDVLPMAVVENNSIVQFVGPPRYNFGGEWVPMTYNEDRRGIWLDIGLMLECLPGALVLDFEHGKFTADYLSRRGLEYGNIPTQKIPSLTDVELNIFEQTGIVYRQDMAPQIPYPFNIDNMITRYAPRVVHAGGLHPALIEISDDEADNPYHRHLKEVLSPDMWLEVKNRRIASHAPIEQTDTELLNCLKLSMLNGADSAVVEVCAYGEGAPKGTDSPGCWYWSAPDAQTTSFYNCIELVSQAREAIGLFN